MEKCYNHCNHMSREVSVHTMVALIDDERPSEFLVDVDLVGAPTKVTFAKGVYWVQHL